MDATTTDTNTAAAPLDFEKWCDLSARLLQRDDEERLGILIGLEIDPLDWTRSDAHWSVELVRDIRDARMERPRHYGARCATELSKRREHSEPPAPQEGAASEPAARVPAIFPAVVATPTIEVMEAPITSMEPRSPPTPVEPWIFTPPAVAPPPVVRPRPSFAMTADSFELPSHLRAPTEALPFRKADASDEVMAFAPAASEAPTRSPASSETLPLGINLLAQVQAALPFVKNASVTSNTRAVPKLTIQTYASLCAELAVTPDKTPGILAKYSIHDANAHRAVDEEWRARFAAHPETLQEWQKLYSGYMAWLRQSTR